MTEKTFTSFRIFAGFGATTQATLHHEAMTKAEYTTLTQGSSRFLAHAQKEAHKAKPSTQG